MADIAAAAPESFRGQRAQALDQRTGPVTATILLMLLAAGVGYGIHGLLELAIKAFGYAELGHALNWIRTLRGSRPNSTCCLSALSQ